MFFISISFPVPNLGNKIITLLIIYFNLTFSPHGEINKLIDIPNGNIMTVGIHKYEGTDNEKKTYRADKVFNESQW